MPNESPNNLTHLGKFELLEKIGEGGMDALYRAKQISLQRIVALKVLPPRLASDKTCIESFRREARGGARLFHPNIIPVFDAGEAEGHYHYAMKFVRGKTLFRWVQKDGKLTETTVLEIGKHFASASDDKTVKLWKLAEPSPFDQKAEKSSRLGC